MQQLCLQPQGFRTCAKNIGIKDATLDFTVIASEVPAPAAALFTQNRFCGAAIVVGREQVANGQLQAFVINSKNANVATGEQGLANIREVVRLVADELAIAPDALHRCLKEAVDHSFNMVSIDTDTSTSDTVAIMANGLAGEVDLDEFRRALQNMAVELAKELARDGEGATKLIEVTVDAAASRAQAKRVAKSIVNSPLVKTAVFGADPNWGRIAMAIGKCEEQISIVPENVSIAFGDLLVYQGQALGEDNLTLLQAYLHHDEIAIRVSLGLGDAKATAWGCDLTPDYVRINGTYTT
jgi:glutamate N-acetyltransferase / amino-acid N-acetyltransferase